MVFVLKDVYNGKYKNDDTYIKTPRDLTHSDIFYEVFYTPVRRNILLEVKYGMLKREYMVAT